MARQEEKEEASQEERGHQEYATIAVSQGILQDFAQNQEKEEEKWEKKEAREEDLKEEHHMDQLQDPLEEESLVRKEDSREVQERDFKDFATIAEDLDIAQAIVQRKEEERAKECTM